MKMPQSKTEPYVLTYNDLNKETKGEKRTLEVDVVIGGDGANSRVAKAIDAGDYEYAIAFQERMKIPDDKMDYYKDRAEMYVGEDVSPDFYAWVFPKCDHVAVGTGTVIDKKGIQKYQQGIRDRAKTRIEGGEILRVEAHPIPEHPRPYRTRGRATLIGDAAGYVTKCSGEGIYFAAKSGRMCAETIAKRSENGTRMIRSPTSWSTSGSGTPSTGRRTSFWTPCRSCSTPPTRRGKVLWSCVRRSTCRRSPSIPTCTRPFRGTIQLGMLSCWGRRSLPCGRTRRSSLTRCARLHEGTCPNARTMLFVSDGWLGCFQDR